MIVTTDATLARFEAILKARRLASQCIGSGCTCAK